MKIGHGDIASMLPDREGFCFFASGVSNSKEKRESEYKREADLLMEQRSKKLHIVYFSSLGVFEGDTRYYHHKREMERLVKEYFPSYTIVRLGNITWGKNPHTLINAMKNRVKKGKKLIIKNIYRYLVDEDEFLYWIIRIPTWNCEMNIVGKRMKVFDIVKEYVL